jgi:hypothetical protein
MERLEERLDLMRREQLMTMDALAAGPTPA